MKLTDEMKQRIDAYFESKTPQEVADILGSYGLEIEQEKPTLDRLYERVQDLRDFALKVDFDLDIEISTYTESYNVFSSKRKSSISINVND